jgi:uncharacterized protein YjbI with pentapeptide repeats
MANDEHLEKLEGGWRSWSQWRKSNAQIRPDLTDVDLSGRDLCDYDFSETNLRKSNFTGTLLCNSNLIGSDIAGCQFKDADLTAARVNGAHINLADFSNANLTKIRMNNCSMVKAKLTDANGCESEITQSGLSHANLEGANFARATLDRSHFNDAILRRTNLEGASLVATNLVRADLSHTNLRDGNLMGAFLLMTNLQNADLTGCKVYGIAAWDIQLQGATQSDLVITAGKYEKITVDNIEIAQFIYFLLESNNIRNIIDTITSKLVLILGRFTPERKSVLDALREGLRKHNYLPVVFDFPKPKSRDLTETISTLAHMARFVIVDLTDPRSVPHELASIVPNLRSVPFLQLIHADQRPYAMFSDLERLPSVMTPIRYKNERLLISNISALIIHPAEEMVRQLRPQGGT